MNYTLVKDLYKRTEKYIGQKIKVSGWVKTLRNSKNFGFIELNDGTFFNNIQIVFDDKLDNFEDICKFTQVKLKYINYLIQTILFKRKILVLNF